jgi:ribosomal protein L12E/L44/L45/RPP1/RPP2
MTETDAARKLDELEHLLNDPEVPLQPARVRSLLAELAGRDLTWSRTERGTPGTYPGF